MSTPTDYEIARAQRAGRAFARAGKPVTDCPFDANGDGSQRVLAMRFARAYLAERPAEGVDYTD